MEDIDLKRLIGNNQLTSQADGIIDNLLNQVESLSVSVEGTGDLFKCAINLGDLVDLDLDLDFFKSRQDSLSYTLLYKIQQLKRYINNINNIFIKLIADMKCCNSDDRYNRLILPIFKWLVEDPNGLCGTLLKISRELYTIYLPLKRITCLFKPLPGNPTLLFAGIDYFKMIYPVIEGVEKAMNMIDAGRFLDIIIVPVKNFHDKLTICANGEDVDLYSGYDSIKDILSLSIYDELTVSLIDELKATKELEKEETSSQPKPPIFPSYNGFYNDNPRPIPTDFIDTPSYFKALYGWNEAFGAFKYTIDFEYNKQYSTYLSNLKKFREDRFKATLDLNEADYSSSNLVVDLSVEDFKKRYKPICGCLAEIFNADGFFFPKKRIIRSYADLNNLVGEVEYRGMSAENYYFNDELNGKRRIKIINAQDLKDIENKQVVTDLDTSVANALNISIMGIGPQPDKRANKVPMDAVIKLTPTYNLDDYLKQINEVRTVRDVLDLNIKLTQLYEEKYKEYRIVTAFADTVKSAFKKVYDNEILTLNNNIARNKAVLYASTKNEADRINIKDIIINQQRELTNYAFMPPSNWDKNTKQLTGGYASGIGKISYADYENIIIDAKYLDYELTLIKQAINRNHAVVSLVDENGLECSCDLICIIIKYIINIILSVIKKVITFIIMYLTKSILNKELQWWLEFISQKISCILGIVNLGKEISEMRDRFEREIESGDGMLQEARMSLANCSDTRTKSLLTDMLLSREKAKISDDSLKDITWVETNYPDFEPGHIDITQNDSGDNNFSLELKNTEYEPSEWKNRSIPTIITDCSKDHLVKASWKPISHAWSAYLNVTIDMAQFNLDSSIILEGNFSTTEEKLIDDTYRTLIWNILNSVVGLEDFNFEIEVSSNILKVLGTDITLINNELHFGAGTIIDINTIDRVWFNIEDSLVKIFDRLQVGNINTIYKNTQAYIQDTLDTMNNIEDIEFDDEEPTSSKVCSPNNLVITTFRPLYDDPNLNMYPGPVIKNVTSKDTLFVFTPILKNGTYFHRNNTPFLLEMENFAGRKYTVILLIDICKPDAVMNTNYNRSNDGVFLNGRYDYIEFDAIPNNTPVIYNQKDIIKKLSKFLEDEGLISSLMPGILGSVEKPTDAPDLIDNTEAEEIYVGIDTSGDNDPALSTGNLPAGLRKTIFQQQAKLNKLGQLLNDMSEYIRTSNDTLDENLAPGMNEEIAENLLNGLSKEYRSHLGIPLMVLNDEENIILTIHKKKLKLLNINRSIGIGEPDLEIDLEIDYRENENLFIEFTTDGFSHTISWINERKIKRSAMITSTSILDLSPTYLGSVYKFNNPVALLCGKINDIIFSNSNRTVDDWFNNSNTYRPDSTIGFYDFSLFDGYHVYSIPEFFKVTSIGELATVKGILYESDKYTKEEIAIMLQDGKINEIEQTKLTIVGERPISVGGDFIWQNQKYYKNVTFGYLDNFFCRDNLSGEPFTISFWLKHKDAATNNRVNSDKKYIIADTNNGNFIWLEDDVLNIKLFGQPLRSEPAILIFKKDIFSGEPEYVEKWFQHIFRYDRVNAKVYYDIICINDTHNFDINYKVDVLNRKRVVINLGNITGKGRVMDFSLVSMLARYDMKTLKYVDLFLAEITALAIWKEFRPEEKIISTFNYQKRIINNESGDTK